MKAIARKLGLRLYKSFWQQGKLFIQAPQIRKLMSDDPLFGNIDRLRNKVRELSIVAKDLRYPESERMKAIRQIEQVKRAIESAERIVGR